MREAASGFGSVNDTRKILVSVTAAQIVSLSGTWNVRSSDGSLQLVGTVPGCVHTDLRAANLMGDPHWRDEEKHQLWITEKDWIYERRFSVTEAFLEHEHVELVAEGLDTLTEIQINGNVLATTDNMFRCYRFPLNDRLKAGENSICVTFRSPLPLLAEKHAKRPLTTWNVNEAAYASRGYIRKMACSFGWDWGLMGATAGIWKPINLEAWDAAKLDNVRLQQVHEDGLVRLHVVPEFLGAPAANEQVRVIVEKDSAVVCDDAGPADKALTCTLTNPTLWFPNSLGSQPLYTVRILYTTGDGSVRGQLARRIGLRTLALVREADEYGESFTFSINGRKAFMKGANWIPAELYPSAVDRQRLRPLLVAARDSHMTMLRVWGGGIYESEDFYDLCDELGLLVWQDFAFACGSYPLDDPTFVENARMEAIDNIRRLRHRASLALWCGNNELEQGIVGGENYEDGRMPWKDYVAFFDGVLGATTAEYDGVTPFWPGSPHTPAPGDRLDFNDNNRGDTHMWSVWFGGKPFEAQRQWTTRFMSEFGFQSFPEMKTIEAFTEPEDRNLTSYIMDFHQRSGPGNKTILSYIASWFLMPNSLASTVTLSQLSQALCVEFATEHLRRIQPRSMGVLYWQLNDLWPAPTWSSIDYFGRWKALQHFARRFNEPLHVSLLEHTESTPQMAIHLSNQRLDSTEADVHWRVVTTSGVTVEQGSLRVLIPAQTNEEITRLDCETLIQKFGRRSLLFYSWAQRSEDSQTAIVMNSFSRPKHLTLEDPGLESQTVTHDETRVDITLQTQRPALWVRLSHPDPATEFSDNYFHLLPGQPKTISATTATAPTGPFVVESLISWS